MLPKLKDLKKSRLSITQEVSSILGFLLKKLKPILLLIIAGFLIVILNSEGSLVTSLRHEGMSKVASMYQALNTPLVWMKNTTFHINQALNAHNLLPDLTAENEALKQKIKSYEAMEEENNRLRNLLQMANHSLYSPIAARVVSESFKGSESKFLINAGKEAGITEGMAVINQDGLIGRVIEVGEQSARVMALQDEQSSIPAIVKPLNKRCVVRGHNGLVDLRILYIKKEELMAGMEVSTSGDGDLLPKNLHIGTIAEDGKSLSPAFKLENLDYILVLKLNKNASIKR